MKWQYTSYLTLKHLKYIQVPVPCKSSESKGWTVGKQPMKDWKAAVRNWERNGYSGSSKRDEQVVKGSYDQRQYDEDFLNSFVNADLD